LRSAPSARHINKGKVAFRISEKNGKSRSAKKKCGRWRRCNSKVSPPQGRWRPRLPRRGAGGPICPAGPPEAENCAPQAEMFWCFVLLIDKKTSSKVAKKSFFLEDETSKAAFRTLTEGGKSRSAFLFRQLFLRKFRSAPSARTKSRVPRLSAPAARSGKLRSAPSARMESCVSHLRRGRNVTFRVASS
jgi:hypothetical protein